MTIFVPRPTPSTYQGSLARFHRLRPTATHDGTWWWPTELGMLDGFAGSVMSGTPVSGAIDTGFAYEAFDGSDLTGPKMTMASNPWVGLDHGTAELLVEFYLESQFFNPSMMPSEMVLEESVDGITWSVVRTYSDIPPWRTNERRYYPVADTELANFDGLWRFHRMRAITVDDPDWFQMAAAGFFAELGDGANVAGELWSCNVASGDIVATTDSDPFTVFAVFLNDGGWIGMYHGHTPIAQIKEVLLGSAWNFNWMMPTVFNVEGSNWAGLYDVITEVTTAAWPTSTTRRFTV